MLKQINFQGIFYIQDLPYVDYEMGDNKKIVNIIGYVPMMVAWWAEKYSFT